MGDHVSRLNEHRGSCVDCVDDWTMVYGPVDFEGNHSEYGDYLCRTCAGARGVVFECPECRAGVGAHIPVWEGDEDDGAPDYIGCTGCGTMKEYGEITA